MAPRSRNSHPTKGDMGGYNNGEPLSLSSLTMRNRHSMGVVTAIALAALAAALAAVATAIGALSILYDRNKVISNVILPPSRSDAYARSLRSASFHASDVNSSTGNDFDVPLLSSGQDDLAAGMGQSRDGVAASTMIHIKRDAFAKAIDQSNTKIFSPHTQESTTSVISYAEPIAGGPLETGPLPMIAWLMSFPNSGTSYTIHLSREVSNTTTATNYGLEGDIKDEPSVPVNPGYENGPFLELIKTIQTDVPPRYILTKTHCTGFCAECNPESYIETPRSFQMGCLSGRRGMRSKDGGKIKIKHVQYEPELVKRAVHIIRNPLDNVVARFHLEHKRHKKLGEDEWPKVFPNTKTGFQKWCANIDAKPDLTQARWVDDRLAERLSAAPCHAEFFRYVQWHNLAFAMARDMAVPTFVFHYEDYRDNFEETLSGLLDFLELPRVKDGPAFELGKEYKDYYTAEQRTAVANLIEESSSLETWQHLKHYFEEAQASES